MIPGPDTGPDAAARMATTRRPAGLPLMKQGWRDLLFLHWAVRADALRKLLPPGLEVDLFGGRAYVGLVPFTMRGVRLSWLPPLPPTSRFHEVNLRTYVHRNGADPGVWFFSLDASSSLAVHGARAAYGLPYRYARIRFEVESAGPEPAGPRRRWIRFESRRVPSEAPECDVRYGPAGLPAEASPGSLEHFLVERYVLYAWRGGRLSLARVSHRPYPLQPAVVDFWKETLFRAAGLDDAHGDPLAHYAQAVDVDVFPLRRA